MDERRGDRALADRRAACWSRGAGATAAATCRSTSRRCEQRASPVSARLHVEVEVANFYPAIASGLGRWIYNATQSRIHVIVTYGFLRSLARLDLAESRVGRFARIEDVPDPPPANAGHER